MNSINNSINGLASSLLLTVGFTSVAEKLDPTRGQAGRLAGAVNSAEPCIVACNFSAEPCIVACNFSPEIGQ
jgi:hypothetical protein